MSSAVQWVDDLWLLASWGLWLVICVGVIALGCGGTDAEPGKGPHGQNDEGGK